MGDEQIWFPCWKRYVGDDHFYIAIELSQSAQLEESIEVLVDTGACLSIIPKEHLSKDQVIQWFGEGNSTVAGWNYHFRVAEIFFYLFDYQGLPWRFETRVQVAKVAGRKPTSQWASLQLIPILGLEVLMMENEFSLTTILSQTQRGNAALALPIAKFGAPLAPFHIEGLPDAYD